LELLIILKGNHDEAKEGQTIEMLGVCRCRMDLPNDREQMMKMIKIIQVYIPLLKHNAIPENCVSNSVSKYDQITCERGSI